MNDDLVKRLDRVHWCVSTLENGVAVSDKNLAGEAKDRIAELEAKLAKAMEHVADYSNDPHLVEWANATLAELKGDDNE